MIVRPTSSGSESGLANVTVLMSSFFERCQPSGHQAILRNLEHDSANKLNPQDKPGRITVITRMGAENMRVKLPPFDPSS
ncbi:unnamed protein product [Musa acuminata subsp. malaccensis]|uniref:(wild Malaysian banana) hypothetical protein n=1 Tax=Musa acuminata subsp. malaccensis TaxID=214687 RepID=A0A804J6D1_MUSAM|nr:unnamed protein product [Musa acuminata subsp. malaccensis]